MAESLALYPPPPHTGWARLIRTRLIRSSTLFQVSVKSLPNSYHFMFLFV